MPTVLFGLLIPLMTAAVGLRQSGSIASLVSAIPLHWIVAAQVYRIGGGIFLVLWADGRLPWQFALPAGIGGPFTRQLSDRAGIAIAWGVGTGLYGMLIVASASAFDAKLQTATTYELGTRGRRPDYSWDLAVYRMNSLEGLGVLNKVLSVFEAKGLDVEMRARQFRIFGYFLTGSCLDETIGYSKGPSAAEPVPHEMAAEKFPAIMAVGRYFSPEHHARTFELGLEALIAEIERLVALRGK